MPVSDIFLVITWWSILFVIGAAAFPLTRRLFGSWWDQGYGLSKAVGLATVTYGVWVLGSFHLLPFRFETIVLVVGAVFMAGIGLNYLDRSKTYATFRVSWKRVASLEVLFFVALLFWSFIKAHEPDIHGLEKFMDYGFSESILHSDYFPPPDMWYAGGTINYYYFGHTVQALLSRLSGVDLTFGYNLMLSTIFALCFSMSFGIAVQLFLFAIRSSGVKQHQRGVKIWAIVSGAFTAFLVTLSGNMQTIYAFTKGYSGEDNPPAFWTVMWPVNEFLTKLPDGMMRYWYANATRFIPFTIHEFPSYSFVVSDNHGHVFSIPFVLLALSALLTMFAFRGEKKKDDKKSFWAGQIPFALFGGLIGILFMTNALDGPIYLGLFCLLLASSPSSERFFSWEWFQEKGMSVAVVISSFIVTALPFLLTFKSFATGLAFNCPPAFLANSKIGPFLFETVDKCQRSPLWMMMLLWGFFWFCGAVFVIKTWHSKKSRAEAQKNNLSRVLTVIFFYCVSLIVFAEFFYFKDIYPAHFRSNTMFKLGYQSFIMSSILSGFVIVQMILAKKQSGLGSLARRVFFVLLVPQLFLISVFPYFSIRSYFGNLSTYRGLYGLSWFATQYPDDLKAMMWLKTEPQKRVILPRTDTYLLNRSFFTSHIPYIPVIVEADGDSYTDYNRMSAFSGLPTIVGWGVHEWLWRGTYDVVSPRKGEVQQIYESEDLSIVRSLLAKYNVAYVVVGSLERDKFKALQENNFLMLGSVAFRSGETVIYALDKM